MKFPLQILKFTLATILTWVSSTIFLQIQVQSQQTETTPDVQQAPPEASESRLIFNLPQATRRPPPGRRRGGGTHGGNQCPSLNPPLTALVPGTEENSTGVAEGTITTSASRNVIGLTAEGEPTFWFYIPYPSTSNLSAKFVLVNDQDELVYQNTFPLTGIPGIVKVRPTSTLMSAPLEVGKRYHWSLSIICNPQDSSANTYVEGWIERVELTTNSISQLKTATSEEKAIFYAQQGFWYETLINIENLCSTDPKKANLLLTSLLQSVGLNDIAQQPSIQCSQPNN